MEEDGEDEVIQWGKKVDEKKHAHERTDIEDNGIQESQTEEEKKSNKTITYTREGGYADQDSS